MLNAPLEDMLNAPLKGTSLCGASQTPPPVPCDL